MGFLDLLENNPALRSALGQLGAAVLPAVLSEVLGMQQSGRPRRDRRKTPAGGVR